MGRAASEGRVDSGEHATFGGYVRASINEDPLCFSPALPGDAQGMLCHERIATPEGVDSACLRVFKTK